MAELIRITTYPGKQTVYRSSITGEFVSKSYYLNNPDTTCKMSVKTPKYEWVDPEELLYGFRQIQFYDSTDSSWTISLPKPIHVAELSTVCDEVNFPFSWIIETLYNLPYWREVLRVDVHEASKARGISFPAPQTKLNNR